MKSCAPCRARIKANRERRPPEASSNNDMTTSNAPSDVELSTAAVTSIDVNSLTDMTLAALTIMPSAHFRHEVSPLRPIVLKPTAPSITLKPSNIPSSLSSSPNTHFHPQPLIPRKRSRKEVKSVAIIDDTLFDAQHEAEAAIARAVLAVPDDARNDVVAALAAGREPGVAYASNGIDVSPAPADTGSSSKAPPASANDAPAASAHTRPRILLRRGMLPVLVSGAPRPPPAQTSMAPATAPKPRPLHAPKWHATSIFRDGDPTNGVREPRAPASADQNTPASSNEGALARVGVTRAIKILKDGRPMYPTLYAKPDSALASHQIAALRSLMPGVHARVRLPHFDRTGRLIAAQQVAHSVGALTPAATPSARQTAVSSGTERDTNVDESQGRLQFPSSTPADTISELASSSTSVVSTLAESDAQPTQASERHPPRCRTTI
jgi:hypothetical protein